MPHILTADEKQFFAENGYLIVRGAVERDLMDRLREELWTGLPVDRNDPRTWVGKELGVSGEIEHSGAPLELSQHANVYGIAEQFVGGGTMRPPDGISAIIRAPNPGTEWKAPALGHLDGYNRKGRYSAFTIAATLYAAPVEHTGGAFMFWPGSPRKAWDYFSKNSLGMDYRWLGPEGEDPYCTHQAPRDGFPAGTEFLGEPGDVIFWHALMMHNGSANATRNIRFGLFMRFIRNDIDDVLRDPSPDPWKYWEGMRGF